MRVDEKRKCQQCDKELHGRLDKKFCDDYCRNSYNNQHQRSDELYIKEVNSIIRRNRRILKSLCPIGKATVRKEVLDTMGYNYNHFSGLYRSAQNQIYYVSYDYAFSPIKQKDRETHKWIEKVLIVQRQDYFDKYIPKLW